MDLAAQHQQINVPESSWVGNTTMAGFGIILLVVSIMCIKGNKKGTPMFLWGPMFGALMNRLVTEPTKRMAQKWGGGDEGFDWKSLMTFLVGMWALTSILSSAPGAVRGVAEWLQDIIVNISGIPVLADVGAAGFCFILALMAMRNKDDDNSDLAYGAVCGLIFPLGGGMWTDISFSIGNWIPQVMGIN